MSISVVYDASGHIVSAMDGNHASDGSTTLTLHAGPGEHHSVFDAPKQYHGKNLSEFMHLLHVHTSGTTPHLMDKKQA